MKSITIQELKRLAGDSFTEEEYQQIATSSAKSKSHDTSKFSMTKYDNSLNKNIYGYDNYSVDLLDFEFMSVDCMHFEEKENRHGNKNFFMRVLITRRRVVVYLSASLIEWI